MVKKIFGLSVGVSLVLATVVPAIAAGNSCANQITGSSSTNNCLRQMIKTHTPYINNTGNLINNIFSNIRSGNNTSNNNTQNASVTSAESNATVDSASSLNTGEVTVNQTDTTVDETGLNDTTGANSNNTVTLNTTKNATVTVYNDGLLQNNVTSNVTSGDNNANNNTIGGAINSGASRLSVLLTNILNSVVITVNQ